ncbi:hypothetical protein DL93DRAFT_2224393 [Clavulina sp. PMI_390]|nr:hypothetical protein DL93DRAFT_2224393 [Clavulina sp. PMI_390]
MSSTRGLHDEIATAALVHSKLITPSLPLPDALHSVVDQLVDIVARYLLTTGHNDQFAAIGRSMLRAQVEHFVEDNTQLEFVLPAFPFKSPSTKKVLGVLPDLAEEIFLRRLEDLCRSVGDFYSPGAQLVIVSDGIVYSELLGISDVTAYQYNAALRTMTSDLGLIHLKFARVKDLLQKSRISSSGHVAEQLSEEEYCALAAATRKEFLESSCALESTPDNMITSDEGTLRTYRGYLRFLQLDLRDSSLHGDGRVIGSLSRRERERIIGSIAKEMIENGARFSSLVEKAFPTSIRLSIHPHTNAGPKFALKIFQNVELACTPWHNTAVMKKDGSFMIQHHATVDRATHMLVKRNGLPYYWRESDPAMDWGDIKVTFEPLFPYGLIIRPQEGLNLSWAQIPMEKLRDLARRWSLILARGFSPVNKDEYRSSASRFGPIMPWVWGDILEVKEEPQRTDLNSTTSHEAMPMHFDGVFKLQTLDDGTAKVDPPQFQMFHCRRAPSSEHGDFDAGGRTLFANGAIIHSQMFESGVFPYAQEVVARNWTVFTPQNGNWGGEILELPLVETNQLSGRKTLRWHEPWPQEITKYKPTNCSIVGLDAEESRKLSNSITALLYDRRFTYEHVWEQGDYLIADNIELLHTRTAFTPCDRELWRIHIN